VAAAEVLLTFEFNEKNKMFSRAQVSVRDFREAAKAQRASVTAAEIVRYEEYNDRHGAQYSAGAEDGSVADEDEW
jgi:hypothetical protein